MSDVTPAVPMPELVDEYAAAQILCVSVKTIRAWRLRKQGPCWHKLGSTLRAPVRYAIADLRAWIASCVVGEATS